VGWFDRLRLNERGAIILRRKLSRGQLEAKLANLPPCLIGMEACVGAHHLSRRLKALGHDARLMPARYVRAYLKGNKNDFRDAEAIAEAVQRPTMRFVATKTAEQLDLQALHRVRSRLVGERTAIANEIRAFLLDRGIAVAKGLNRLRAALPASWARAQKSCPRASCTSSRTWSPTGATSISASTMSRCRSRLSPSRTPAASG
jgi:transposase